MLRFLGLYLVLFGTFSQTALAEVPKIYHTLIEETFDLRPGQAESALYRNRGTFMKNVTDLYLEVRSNTGCVSKITSVVIEVDEFSPRVLVPVTSGALVHLPKPGLLGVILRFDNPSSTINYCGFRVSGIEDQCLQEGGPNPEASRERHAHRSRAPGPAVVLY